MSRIAAVLPLAALAAALPTLTPSKTINARAGTSECAQWASVTAGAYILSNDLWGEDSASSGSQCFTLDSSSSDSIAWTSTWSWSGASTSVKSYNNAVYNFTKSKLSDISSIPSKWEWSYDGTDIEADVSYDLFTASTPDGSEEYEIMIWLAALGGAGPIASSYSADGLAVPLTNTTIGGYNWGLYKGSNGIQTATYSFIATETVNSFSGDINDFLQYLVSDQSFDASQYLVSVGAGTEAFTGSDAVFKVSSYSVDVSTGGSGSSGSAASSAVAKPATSSSAAAVSVSSAPATTSTSAVPTSASAVPVGPESSTGAPVPSTYGAPTSSSVVPISTVSASVPVPTYSAPSASSSVATSVGAVGTSAAAPPYPYSGASSAPAAPFPTGTGSPDPACEIEYVYV